MLNEHAQRELLFIFQNYRKPSKNDELPEEIIEETGKPTFQYIDVFPKQTINSDEDLLKALGSKKSKSGKTVIIKHNAELAIKQLVQLYSIIIKTSFDYTHDYPINDISKILTPISLYDDNQIKHLDGIDCLDNNKINFKHFLTSFSFRTHEPKYLEVFGTHTSIVKLLQTAERINLIKKVRDHQFNLKDPSKNKAALYVVDRILGNRIINYCLNNNIKLTINQKPIKTKSEISLTEEEYSELKTILNNTLQIGRIANSKIKLSTNKEVKLTKHFSSLISEILQNKFKPLCTPLHNLFQKINQTKFIDNNPFKSDLIYNNFETTYFKNQLKLKLKFSKNTGLLKSIGFRGYRNTNGLKANDSDEFDNMMKKVFKTKELIKIDIHSSILNVYYAYQTGTFINKDWYKEIADTINKKYPNKYLPKILNRDIIKKFFIMHCLFDTTTKKSGNNIRFILNTFLKDLNDIDNDQIIKFKQTCSKLSTDQYDILLNLLVDISECVNELCPFNAENLIFIKEDFLYGLAEYCLLKNNIPTIRKYDEFVFPIESNITEEKLTKIISKALKIAKTKYDEVKHVLNERN